MNQPTGKNERDNHMTECTERMHFIHDVRYVTISLNKDRQNILNDFHPDILSMPIAPVKERFANEYEQLIDFFYQELHNNNESEYPEAVMNTLDQLLFRYDQFFYTLEEWQVFLQNSERELGLNEPVQCMNSLVFFEQRITSQNTRQNLPAIWFTKSKQQEIAAFLDKIQMKTEELIEARSKILIAWKPQIVNDEYDEMLNYLHHMEKTSLKYLNANFWKTKKQMRQLFLLETRQLTEQELKQLIADRNLAKKNSLWLQMKQAKIEQYFGNLDAVSLPSIKEVRNRYETFHRIWSSYQKLNVTAAFDRLQQLFPELSQSQLLTMEFAKLKEYLLERRENLRHLKEDYQVFYQLRRDKHAEFGLQEMRKAMYLTERVQIKTAWMMEQSDMIEKVFGTTKISEKTDWESYQKSEQQLEFKVYESSAYSFDTMTSIEEYILSIVTKEQPISEQLLLKKVVTGMNLTRINASVKASYQSFLQQHVNQVEVVDGFVETVDKTDIQFRIPSEGKREIAGISDSELRAGVLELLMYETELTLEEIEKQIAGYLGYPRRTAGINTRISQVVNKLKREGKISRYSAGWRLEA